MKTPSEHFRLPVIGKIKTKPMTCNYTSTDGVTKPVTYPSSEYEVISKTNLGKIEAYLCNQWYKEYRHEPLVITVDFVEEFTPV